MDSHSSYIWLHSADKSINSFLSLTQKRLGLFGNPLRAISDLAKVWSVSVSGRHLLSNTHILYRELLAKPIAGKYWPIATDILAYQTVGEIDVRN